jgi:hypothetical protein
MSLRRKLIHQGQVLTSRFCWFMAWIYHKTEVLEDPTIRTKGLAQVLGVLIFY